MQKSKLNININRDEHHLNDYLYCWSFFGERPHKVSLFSQFEPEKFLDFVSKSQLSNDGTFTDIISTADDFVVNEKSLIQLESEVFISFTLYDKDSEESFIAEVILIYKNESSDEVNKIISSIQDFQIELEEDDTNKKISTLSIGQNGLELSSINFLKSDYENIDFYFNDNVIKQSNKLIKSIKKNSKGLSIVYGERGCGKTTLVNHIASLVDKNSIFIPCNMIESTINHSEFRNFIKKYNNSVLIIDDSEIYLSDSYSKSNIITNNLLQLVDGFQSDDFNLNIILILNESNINEIDHSLLECNNLIDLIEVDELTPEKVIELNNHLGKKSKSKNSMKLIDVLKKRNFISEDKEIGF